MLQDYHEAGEELREDHQEAGEGEDHHIRQDLRNDCQDILIGMGLTRKLTAMPEVVAVEQGENGAKELGLKKVVVKVMGPLLLVYQAREGGPGIERQRWQSSQPYSWQKGGDNGAEEAEDGARERLEGAGEGEDGRDSPHRSYHYK